MIAHYRQNPNLKVLGVTATPDRADEAALGQIFESVAYDYEIGDAIHDGWLVPVTARAVVVEGLDLSSVRTTAGDLNGADLAALMEHEECLHRIAHPTWELTQGRKVLVFAASVPHAERLAEILNRHEPNCADWVCGETPKEQRRKLFSDYAAKRFRILVNVGVATEGFDDPGIEVVAIARPTKSRALYTQMVGRGTRPLPGIVDRVHDDLFAGEWGPDERRAAIEGSAKRCIEVLDFVGNAGRHKLVSTADILGGKYSDEIVERAARKQAAADGKPVDMAKALAEAEEEERNEREKARRAEESRRAALRIKAKYATEPVDAFDTFHVTPPREHGWDSGRQISEKMRALLEKQGIDCEAISYGQAKALIAEIFRRWDAKLCSLKQARLLKKWGIDASNMSREEASARIDERLKKRKPVAAVAAGGIERF